LSSVRATELDLLLLGVTMNQDEQRLFGGVLSLDDASETLHFVGTGETWPPRAGPGGDRRPVTWRWLRRTAASSRSLVA